MANLIGQSLGRYHILEQLGEGGMATVYKAYDTRLEREVAVKIVRIDQFAPAMLEQLLKRFEREAKSLAKLAHPNIIKVNDFGEYNGVPYLVMEYLPGGSLKNRMGKPMQWQEAVYLLRPIARALAYAHQHGVIHRDVKPANVLISDSGEPMLTDFGIAKMLESGDSTNLTGTGIGMGTPEYMAPEQWTGQATAQSDIYSLGVVFFELVTGRKPYTAETPAAVLLKQASEPLPAPTRFVSGLPDAVEKVIIKALAKRPEDRYQKMADLSLALENLLSGSVEPDKDLASEKSIVLQKATNEKRVPSLAFPVPKPSSPTGKKPGWVPGVIGLFVTGIIIACMAISIPVINLVMSTQTATLPSTIAVKQGTGSNPNNTEVPNNSKLATATPLVFSFNISYSGKTYDDYEIQLEKNMQCTLFINQVNGDGYVDISRNNKSIAYVRENSDGTHGINNVMFITTTSGTYIGSYSAGNNGYLSANLVCSPISTYSP